jgi:YVTN family beta-propeller protein
VSPNGAAVYVTTVEETEFAFLGHVKVIETTSREVIGDVGVGEFPGGLAVSTDGMSLYVANRYSDTVSTIDVRSRQVLATIPVGDYPTAVAVWPPLQLGCMADCNGDREVTVDEILTLVRLLLESAEPMSCPRGDANGDGLITVDEIVIAVRTAILGC